MMFMWSYWQRWDLRASYVFVTCLTIIEISTRFRWRLSLICRQCGFDPLLYLKNPAQAAQTVKNFLDRRKLDPRFLNAPSINIPTREKNQKVKLDTILPSTPTKKIKGHILAKTI